MGNCFLYKRGFGGGFGGGGSTPEVEKTASGKVIAILDSMEKPLKGLRLFGKTTQNGTPSPDAPVPMVSAGNGGSIIVTIGTSESDANPQTLTLSTPNGLPGIHVSEGGNYTDENGWQWICDEVDFAGGKYVQRVKKVDLTKFQYRNSDGTNAIFSTDAYPDYLKTQGKTLLCSHLPTLEDSAAGVNSTLQRGVGASVFNGSAYAIYITFPTNLVGTSMNDLQAYLIEQENAGTPMELYYPSIEPIETPLTSEELAQYAALRTLSPSTTLYNDAGAGMEVKYMAKGG